MTPAEFKKKWSRYQGKETSAYQSHFDDLCRVLGQPTPNEADPTGADFFCYQKRVVKDVELFNVETPDASEPTERGFADVWKKGCFAWEYKGKKKNLDEAYKQLLRYRESLLNPPLLVVCDFDRYLIRTNFNGTVQVVYEFTNAQIDDPKNLRVLRALFENPDFLKPQCTTAEVTEELAETIAEVARSLQSRESREMTNAKSRKEMNFAQRKNLRIARFLNRVVFCFFAEGTGLLPKNLFSEIARSGLDDPKLFAETLEKLFAVMAQGGTFGKDRIRHFNGHLFEESTVFELTEAELRKLADAGEADWQFIEPSIMGTLFERALDASQRSQLGAHYTSEADIRMLVEPVLMSPLRREWSEIKGELAAAFFKGKGNAAQRDKLAAFQKRLAAMSVLDPACGSGNFLYVSLQLLLGLEKEVITFAMQLDFKFTPQVSVQQLRAIEINPYAYELAQVSVQIGFLQWRRDNGFDNDRTPVLQNLDGFQNEDALLVPRFRSKAKTLQEAQAGEHAGDDALKFYTEREWPAADVIVGNPPFLGGSKLWKELGRHYQKELWKFTKAACPARRICAATGLKNLASKLKTENASAPACWRRREFAAAQTASLEAIKDTGDIFFAESDREWTLDGAAVRVSMIGFDDGKETMRVLDETSAEIINSNLTSHSNTSAAKRLQTNEDIAFSGTKKSGDFDIVDALAREWLAEPNPNSLPNSDLIKPWLNGSAIVKRIAPAWIIDTGTNLKLDDFALYEKPYAHAFKFIKPQRDENKREHRRLNWWLHAETCPGMRTAISGQFRFLTTPRVSKFRIFDWADSVVLPDDGIYVFARSDDYFFGVVHSRFHEVWSLVQGTHLGPTPRYTPTTCFETFPFPFPDDLSLPRPVLQEGAQEKSGWEGTMKNRFLTVREEPATGHDGGVVKKSTPAGHRAAIAAAAQELHTLRERWLNPWEWTVERVLEFPGSTGGAWQRYLDAGSVDAQSGVGVVRYPRLEPRDAACAAKLKARTLTKLYNERPAWLDLAHRKLDAAVAAAYGWSAKVADGEILERLLALNLHRAAVEKQAAGGQKTPVSRPRRPDEMI